MRRGFFGGAFDPIHQGHLNLAHQVQKSLALDEIAFIPNAAPPHKKGTALSYELRVDLLNLALKGEEHMTVSDLERDRSHAHYTYDSLKLLRKRFGSEESLFFLMGMDSLLALNTWHLGLKLTDFAHLVVIKRPGFDLSSAGSIIREYLSAHEIMAADPRFEEALNEPCGHIFIIESRELDVSSTDLRAAIVKFYASKDEQALNFLREEVPNTVLKEILKLRLYEP